MDEKYFLMFILAPGIGPKTLLVLIRYFGTAEAAWKANEHELKEAGLGSKTLNGFLEFRTGFSIQEYAQKLTDERVIFISQNSKQYPQSLKQLENPPIGLFCKGNVNLLPYQSKQRSTPHDTSLVNYLQSPNIAVVGTRKTTSYGRQVTEKLVSQLAVNECTIVSGLALGVDAIAHRTTLDQNGKTIAVLGCGVDCCSPAENQTIYNRILEQEGLIISEYPLGEPPQPGTFPARNRIIAALSQAVLVTEAASDSGSLITADWAQKLGKKVFAVPGPITSRQSDGTAYLLKRGAKFVTNAEDILEELNLKKSNGVLENKLSDMDFSSQELKIIELLQDEPLSVDQISKKTNTPVQVTSSLLSGLEIRGIVKDVGNRIFGMI